MPRKSDYIQRIEKTEGGVIITQIDMKIGMELEYQRNKRRCEEAEDFYLRMEYRRLHPHLWKLKHLLRWFRASGNKSQ